jgi:hypothetical protein
MGLSLTHNNFRIPTLYTLPTFPHTLYDRSSFNSTERNTTMRHGKLLRHLFGHGSRHSKSKADVLPLNVDDPEKRAAASKSEQLITKLAGGATKPLPPTPHPPKTPERNSHVVEVLPGILEESSPGIDVETPGSPSITVTDTDSPTAGTDTTSARTILTAQVTPAVLDITTFTTRDLLYAAIDEATAATNMHLDTIETTLAVLQALNGFSATVDVLRREMLEKKKVCEEKLGELDGLEETVEEMRFADEIHDVDRNETGEVEREREIARRELEGGM